MSMLFSSETAIAKIFSNSDIFCFPPPASPAGERNVNNTTFLNDFCYI
ncbi:MAG: hypothetical protein LBR79_03545 [Oscillospiraceae bacterium]|nr:hypothetical protein [Oscillospiraceae bacterium]